MIGSWIRRFFRCVDELDLAVLARPPRRRRGRVRLHFDILEDRVTPSNFTVTNTSASAATNGSLPWAVAQANADNVSAEDITFAAADFGAATTITLTSALTLTNTKETITIDGTGVGPITISGGGTSQDVVVDAGVTATFTSLTIVNGFLTGGDGAGIANAGTLTLNNGTVSGCGIVTESASAVAAGYGAGIYNTGSLTLNNSTVSGCSVYAKVLNNDASNGFGGGIANVGGSVTLNNSVVSGCSVITIGLDAEGGGIYNSTTGQLALNGSAVIDNVAQNNVVPATATNPGFAATGTSYNVGDILTVVGGTFTTAATLKVTSVSAITGQVTGVSVNSGGTYTVFPANPVATTDATTPGAAGAEANLGFFGSAVTAATAVGPYNPTFTITNPGAGYYTPPSVFLDGNWINPVTIASATAQVGVGVVTGITLSVPGNDYDSFSVFLSIPGFAGGSGIYNDGTLTAQNSMISGNTGTSASTNTVGGGICSGFGSATASVSLTNSVLTGNSATDGGAIADLNSNGPLQLGPGSAGATLTSVAAAGIPNAAAGSSTTFAVANAWLISQMFTANPNCFIQVDNEQMLVTAVNLAANTVTVTRGYHGTTPAAHAANANVMSPNIFENDAAFGGGIYCSGTTTVDNGEISYNTALDEGGGICCFGTTTISNSTITDNTANYGGGIYSDATATVNNCSISSNSAEGIYSDATLTVNNSTFTANKGDGIDSEANATVNSSTFTNNVSGSALFEVFDTLTVTNSLITDNSGNDGAGIDNASTTTVNNCTISGNSVTIYGGGIDNSGVLNIGGAMTTLSAAVTTTAATSITVANAAVFAAQVLPMVIQIDNEQMQVTAVAGNTLTVTRGYNGTTAATHLINASVDTPNLISGSAAEAGGGIYSVSGTVNLTDGTISGNSVTTVGNDWGGGGIWMESQTGTLVMLNSVITNNTATGVVAAGLLNFGSATITGCTISDNSTTSANVGGIDNVYGTMTILNSTIDDNTATGNAGGLENGNATAIFNIADPNAVLTIEGCTIDGNSVAGDGGGIYDASGSLTVENSALGSTTISGNTASISGGGIYNTVWAENTAVESDDSPWNNSGYTAPGSATLDITLPSGTGRTVTLSATGTITVRVGPENNDPDGIANPVAANIPATNGLSGLIAPNQGAILGVFLNGAENGTQTAPATLNFDTLTTAFTTLAPAVDQVFFAGDGKTGDASGAVQQFTVPNGATTLVLGIAEGNGVGPYYGSGYQVGDILTVPGGTGTAATLKVTAVSAATGQVTGVSVNTPGNYTVDPANILEPTDTTTPSANGTFFELTYVAGAVTAASVWSTAANAGFFTTTEYCSTQGATVTGATISNNVAGTDGGGICNDIVANDTSPLTVQSSTISGNSAVNGGGIWSAGPLSVLSSSLIHTNTASTQGGGIAIGGGSATVDDSTISGNSAPTGGGIYSSSTLTIQNSASIQSNSATTGAGIDLSAGSASVTGSTISGNSASGNGGGIDNAAVLSITGSTLSANTSTAGSGSGGGGLENDGVLAVTDSTITGNSTNGAGGGIRNTGTATLFGDILTANTATGSGAGAISDAGAASIFTVLNSTINGNTSAINAGGLANAGTATLVDSTLTADVGATAGAVSNSGTVSLTNDTIIGNSGTGSAPGGILNSGSAILLNTIVAGNTATVDPDLDNSSGNVTANYSLIGNSAGSGIAGGTGNILNPALTGIGTLGNNGGTNAPTTPPLTVPLLSGSPAIGFAGAATTLAAAVATTGATTITVNAASVFTQTALAALASGSYFTIQIDSELMQVTAMTTAGVMTVTRGVNGSTAATHLVNAPVYLVSDERGDLATFAATPVLNMGALAISSVPYSGLTFNPQPANVQANQSFTITVDTINLNGAAVPGYNGPVTLALGTNPSGATLGGTLTVTAVNGVATFSGLTLNRVGIGYTLTASATGLTGATSDPFNVTASQLTITAEPPSSVMAGAAFTLTVAATDGFGDVDTTYTGNVTLALANNPGGSTLGGTVTVACVAGVASFAGLTLNNIGTGYTIQAASAGLTSAISTAIQVTASQLTFTVEPPPTSIVTNLPFSVTVSATDANGDVDPNFSGTIILSIDNNPGGATLGGTLTVAAVNGVATFSNLTMNNPGTGYTLQAFCGALTPAVSTPFDVFNDHFAYLVAPPATVAAGATFPANVVVQLEDHNGNPLSTANIPASLTMPGATLFGNTLGTTNASGQATFTNLSIDTAGTFTISAGSPGIGSASASTIVTAGPIKSIAFTSQPNSTTAGTILNPVTVQALDQFGNGVPAAAIGMAISASTLNGTLSVTTNSGGDAVFSTLSLDIVGTYTLTASSAGVANAISQPFTISAAAPATLTFITQPNNVNAGTILNPITVKAADQFGNVTSGAVIGIALSSGLLTAGTTPLTSNAAGLVAYTDLLEDVAGTYTLTASTGSISASSQVFVVSPLVSSAALSYLSQPTSTLAGVTINPVTVQAADKFGNPLVVLAISISIAPGTLSGGTTPLTTNASGQVVFGDLVEDTVGTYSLRAAASGITSISSNLFTISPASTIVLSYLSQPNSTTAGTVLNPVTLKAADTFGNPIISSAVSIALTPGTLSGGTTLLTTSSSGQVVFSNLVEDFTGTYTLLASMATLSGVASNAFVISPLVSSAALAYLSQPNSTTAGVTLNPITVQAADKFGNPLVTLAISIAIAPGTLTGGTTPLTTNGAGQVVFGDLLEDTAGTYSLRATASGLTAIVSNTFTISAAAPATLSYLTQPNSTTAGTVLNAVILKVADAFGNPVPGSSVNIALTAGTLSGGTTPLVAGSNGEVSFNDLVEDFVGTYTLLATTSTLSAQSNAFVISPLVSSAALTYLSQPSSTTAGAILNPITVQAADKFGNPLTSLAISIAIAPGTLSGGTTPLTSNASGQVVFSDLVEDKTGTYSLTASATGLASASSGTFTISITPGWTLSFVNQPNTVAVNATLNAITLLAVDEFGNPVPGPVSIALSSGSLNGTTTASANSQGQVVYSNLSVPVTGLYTLMATLQGTSAFSDPFAVTSSADKLSFVVQPTSSTTGASLGQVTVQLADPNGDLLPNVAVSVALNAGSLIGTLAGTTSAQGQVLFDTLSIDKTGTYEMLAESSGITNTSSGSFSITAGTAAKLAFISSPSNTVAGNVLTPVTVKAVDAFGNIVSGITVNLYTTPGKMTGTTLAKTNASGEVVFTGLTETQSATCELTASFSSQSPTSSLSVTSTPFLVSPAAASTITFTSEPNSTTAGVTLNPISVKVEDRFGNLVPGVAVNLYTSINTLSGTTMVTSNAAGQAVFTNLFITKSGSYTLQAGTGTLARVTSTGFTISPAAGVLSFLTEPASTTAGSALAPVTVRVVDKYGNAVVGESLTVQLSSGTLGGTTTAATNASGEAVFTNLTVTQPANGLTLIVSAPGSPSITSATFNIAAAPPPHLGFSTPPAGTAADTTMKSVVVQLYNASGTTLDEANVAVTIKISSGSLSGTLTVFTNSAGQAVFSTLKVGAAGNYTLIATATVNGQSLSVTSASFSVS